jgi:hypothetical protein
MEVFGMNKKNLIRMNLTEFTRRQKMVLMTREELEDYTILKIQGDKLMMAALACGFMAMSAFALVLCFI